MKKICFAILSVIVAACADPEFLQKENELSREARSLSIYRADVQTTFTCPPYSHVPMLIELGDVYGTPLNPNPGYCEKIFPASTYYIMVSGGAAAYCFDSLSGATLANGGGTATCKDATGGQVSIQVTSNTPVNQISVYVTPTDDCGTPQTAYSNDSFIEILPAHHFDQ